MKNTTVINKWACRFALAGLSLIALPVLAQDTQNASSSEGIPAPDSQASDDKSLPTTVSTGLSEQFNTGVATGGTMSVTRFNAGVAMPTRLTDTLVLSTSFRFGLDSYWFRNDGPWHNVYGYTLSSILQAKINDKWSVYGGGMVRQNGEASTKFKDGITGGGIAGVNYKYSDTLSFGGGLGIMSQLEEHATVLPLLTANWKFAEDWTLKLGLSDVASTGYGLRVSYDLSKDWQFGAGLQHQKSRFRIKGYDSSSSGGVGQDQSTTLYADALWHATDKMDLNGFIGLATGGNLRVENATGTELGSSDYNTAAVIGVKASIRF